MKYNPKASEILISSFEITATDLPTDTRCMEAIKELYKSEHMQSDYSDQGVNWILTARSDICGIVVGKPFQVMNCNSLSCLKHL